MSMRRTIAVALGLTAAAATPAVASTFTYAKGGATLADVQAAETVCAEEARGARPRTFQAVANPTGTVAGAATAALIGGIAEGVAKARAERRYVDGCMRAGGFGKVELTGQEAAAFKGVKGDAERKAWIDSFLAGVPEQRIAAGMQPKVPPLPEGSAEAFAIGGLRIDPASVVVASGPVGPRDALVTAKAQHRRTGRVLDEMVISRFGGLRVRPGAIWHQVVKDGETRWCGPSKSPDESHPFCATWTFEEYQVVVDGSPAAWLAAGETISPQHTGVKQAVRIEESETDLIGAVDVELVLKRVGRRGFVLEGVGLRNGKRVVFWRGEPAFDPGGVATLPFWDKTLTLKRTGENGVVASLTDGGDGRGWDELAASAPATAGLN